MSKVHKYKHKGKTRSVAELERKRKRNQIIIGIVIALTMVLSLFGISLFNNPQSAKKFKGIKFYAQGNVFKLKTKPEITLYTYPLVFEVLNYSNTSLQLLKQAPSIALSFDPDMSIASLQALDIARLSFQNQALKPVFQGVLKESEIYKLPIITCDNATQSTVVVVFKESMNDSIQVNNSNCVVVKTSGSKFLTYGELLLLGARGVLP